MASAQDSLLGLPATVAASQWRCQPHVQDADRLRNRAAQADLSAGSEVHM